jgi:mRNA-degrading endonuclease RelE of RelBE toxin-antitoxin system
MKKMTRITFDELPEFRSDLKKLLRKYRSLNDDIEVLRKDLNDEPGERPPFSFRISGLGIKSCIIKIKKIACKSLKGRGVNSGLRLVYAHFEKEEKIIFTELYHKNDKENEDRERILRNFK